ncbi:sulfatase family protein [Snuella sedimenti]|uniref:Sulfatase-like hydrolase/transferase n=1 Tax=Snuella sedimenti TaxID=2798802 RepID=A0A8J7J110_9FLAO|nr:sulfatase-like hydrolase/transferase [Snuella sedimenti]MBJ6367627.1 sulfatase-like hydrolase/transferase [Snuella sedimenti]
MNCFSNTLKSIFNILIFILSFQFYSQNNTKPNVIVIYTDDQGAIDLGSYGAEDIYTPNLDKLAKMGTRFTQAYVAAPVCAPSRAALLTGKYPQNAGLTGNTSATPGSHGLPEEQYTLAELFKDNGYKTGHIGKWHLGMSEASSPNAQGFDYSFGHLRGCIDNYSHFFYWEGPNIHDLHENGKEVFYDGQYFPDLASNKALDFVEKNKKNPFFMYYAINMPHYPYQPTQKWRDYYKDVEKPRGDYGAFISTIDERIGFLIDKLNSLKLLENTIIVYQSDNGYSTEIRAFGGGGNSGPYRGAKSSLFEGGIRLPTIISWKDHLPENIVNDQFLVNIDWMPTLAKLCNLSVTPTNLDGIDMSKMLQNPSMASPRNTAFWKYGNQWVVRKGKWKLIGYPKDTSHKGILNMENDALFLSNLEDNVSEMVNLAKKHPDIVKELIDLYLSWEHGSKNDIPQKMKTVSHLGSNASITALTPLHNKYKNLNVLLDGKRGYNDYASGQWIGQEGTNLELIIDLKATKQLSKISTGYMHEPGNWIFSPKAIEISFSNDGNTFGSPQKGILPTNSNNKNKFIDLFIMKVDQKSRYLKINVQGIGTCPKGHPGDGFPAWFFIDEIIIE